MISSVSQYILAVEHLAMMSRSPIFCHITPLSTSDNTGRPRCFIGNSVVLFEVMHQGQKMAMRVYLRPHKNLRAIYGENYYPNELLVNSSFSGLGLADVVLCDWREGETLQAVIEGRYSDSVRMEGLSHLFEAFALWLLNEEWAHGDLKPENIILSADGLHLIDFDAMYRKGFFAEDCVEVGTRQFQHPQRSKFNFNKSIDDYPIALIATVLAALAIDASLGEDIINSDYLLIKPELAVAGADAMLDRIEHLFAERGDARHYRIARLLRSSHPSLPQLKDFLQAQCEEVNKPERLSLEYSGGYWGFAEQGRFVIPPIYDLAFDFSEGLALVCVGEVWHFIDSRGVIVITCGRGCGIKPFSGGATRIKREDGEFIIYRDGREERV